jgi:precorrin-2 dehydrogenase/sirohydrochlorin ferrochelatase
VNTLYPIFLKTQQLQILIIGGGHVALEKLEFLYKSSPDAHVTMIAPFFRESTLDFIKDKTIEIIEDHYQSKYLINIDIVIATTDSPIVNQRVYIDCRAKNTLCNVSDNPPLCDFYMGSIVTKGNLKIGISTNGKSPTLAKRLRQWLEVVLPDEIDELLNYLQTYRDHLKTDLNGKIKALNKLTKELIS